MKTLLKTVSITLIASVTVLFFSSYRKVEAAGAVSGTSVPFVSLPATEQDVFYEALERFAKEIMGYDTSPEISYTMPDGTVITGTKTEIINEIQRRSDQECISALQDSNGTTLYYIFSNPGELSISSVLTDEFCSTTHKSSNNGVHGGIGKLRVDSSSYNAAVNDFISNSVKTVSGAAAGITMGITTVNGKPQKVTTTYAGSTVEVFDYLGLDYQMFNSLEDVFFDCSVTRTYEHYRPFIITADNKLYVFNDEIELSYKIGSYSSAWIQFVSVTDKFSISTNGENDTYRAFRFYIKDGILGVAFYASNVDTYGRLTRGQFIVSNPSLSTYPVLFSDKLSYTTINSTNFKNYSAIFNLYCVPDKT